MALDFVFYCADTKHWQFFKKMNVIETRLVYEDRESDSRERKRREKRLLCDGGKNRSSDIIVKVVRRLQSKVKYGSKGTDAQNTNDFLWETRIDLTWVNKHLVPSRSIHHLGLTQDQHSDTQAPAHPGDPDAFQRQMISDELLVSTLQEVFSVVKTWQESINTYTNTTWLYPPPGCTLKTLNRRHLVAAGIRCPTCLRRFWIYRCLLYLHTRRTCLACKENSLFGSSTGSKSTTLDHFCFVLPQETPWGAPLQAFLKDPTSSPTCPTKDKQLVHSPQNLGSAALQSVQAWKFVWRVDCSVLLC